MAVSFGVRRLGQLPVGVMGVLGVRSALAPVRGWRRAEFQGIRLLSSPDTRNYTAHGNLSYFKGPTDMKLTSKTVGQCLEDTAEMFPNREALVVSHQNIRKTFEQIKQEVDTAALGLLNLGLSKGDRLGVWGPNSYEWVLMQLATAQAGIILVSVNPAYQSEELKFVLKKVGCKALVFPSTFKTQNYYDILKQICPELETCSAGALRSKNLPELTTVIVLDSKLPGTFHMNDVLQAGKAAQLAQLKDVQRSLSCHDPINIQFTSGTTGRPKGATLSHHNIVNNAIFIGDRMNLRNKEPRLVLPSPLYHCLGSVGGTMVSILYGVTLILSSPSFEGKRALEAVTQERGTMIYGTPTMFVDMLNQPDFSSYDISTLRGGVIAGSSAPPELIRTIIQKMNLTEMTVAYGTTENSPVTFMNFYDDNIEKKINTVGRIMPHTEAQVLDPQTRKQVEINMPGELCIRGYCVMLGYWDDPEKTKDTIDEDKWYWTGDIAAVDEEGFCKIVGRSKDMIIRGGENVYPAELEDFFHKLPHVQEAQVVGVKDERMGEEICACIRLKAKYEGQVTPEELKAYCKGKISHFKIPRYIVFVKEYPLTVSGKIQKYKLREWMEKHLKL
ncbi:medium-chain acyl-CoA ligase ACSF2, mitochondrial [Antechinus flavipes]|uniref:medium-chain acyl-CoA ligase ACSF2, mitochondrial n=1 Tax=Antechinus flavipes TaxID=38775 RepID=UPI002235B2B6|nr:medium-chain acyl-CoA ligase ACSF2, mitochondrial [Antechinus flavipes]